MLTKKQLMPCPLAAALQIFGSRTKILIIGELMSGTKRFSELNKSIPCTHKVLVSNLRELESDSIIIRKIYPVIPPKVEYTLTDVGRSLEDIIEQIGQWGKNYTELNRKE